MTVRRPTTARAGPWVLLLAMLPPILLAACSGGAAAERAVAAVEAFDPADPSTIVRLNEIYRQGEDVVAALAPLLEHGDRDRRWAAVYLAGLLTDTAAEAETLRGALADPDPVIRIIAAGSLAGLGRVDALRVLVDGLGVDAPLFPHPNANLPASDLALETLTFYTGQEFSDPGAWRAWLSQTLDRLTWNGEAYDEG